MTKENKRLFVSMYHYTRDLQHSRYPGIKGLDVSLFRQQMEFFKNFFNVVTMEQVIAASKGGESLPEKALLLTFDDGYIDNYTFALPILEEFGFQGSFFIPGKTFTSHQLLDVNRIHFILAGADINCLLKDVKAKMDYYRGVECTYPATEDLWQEYAIGDRYDSKETVFVKRMLQTALPERIRDQIISDLFEEYVGVSEEKMAYELYMTADQIRTLKRHGMFIGIHGYDHYWLGSLPVEKMKEDISRSLEIMDEFIDPNEWVMNYPYGDYSEDVVAYIEEKKACVGFTTDVRVAELGKDRNLLLPRLDCNDFPPKSENYKNF